MRDELQARLEVALGAVREAGHITLGHFARGVAVEWKSDASPVTIADRESEQHLRRCILRHFPSDAIVGEEFGDQPGESGYRWILDPIDGTKSFIHGVPLYGTLLAVEHGGRSLLGVIRTPATGEMVYAAVGKGAWFQHGDGPPQPARVSDCSQLAKALLLTSELEGFGIRGRPDVLARLAGTCRMLRTWGDAYGYMLVATGRADCMLDPRMHVWDAAALLPILQEAGGTFTDWQGVARADGGNGIATNGKLLDELLAITRGPA